MSVLYLIFCLNKVRNAIIKSLGYHINLEFVPFIKNYQWMFKHSGVPQHHCAVIEGRDSLVHRGIHADSLDGASDHGGVDGGAGSLIRCP